MLLSFLGVLLGGLITWCVSRAYYEKASSDLRSEASRLRWETRRVRERLVDLFAALDEAGLIDVEWNETEDDIKGVRIKQGYISRIDLRRGDTGENSGASETGKDEPDPPTE